MGPAQHNTPAASSSHTSIAAMSTPSPAVKQLPANIPHLKPSGTNWAIFLMRFREAMQASRRWGYFDGSRKRLLPKVEGKAMDDEIEAME